MKDENARISGYNGYSLGVILVLFILLVIVTSVFFCGQMYNGDSSGILSPQTFGIYNDTSSYQLSVTYLTTNAIPVTGNFVNPIPSDGFSQYTLFPPVTNGTDTAIIRYNVLDGNVIVGTLEFKPTVSRTSTGVSSSIKDITKTGPIVTSVFGGGLNLSINNRFSS
ncbi:hypothetical protein [Paenibacillus herberti]|uniref:Uncharacterized protein n=1 Tax=Paenibacillus herberti TaxID=1619309 RepID=A0A229P100_9BACL|nr:hypothetical protein [Paenibacillus herberti]OXM15936.1 hypothetical protein CGZ75_04300 [Paenibacillus herberti]